MIFGRISKAYFPFGLIFLFCLLFFSAAGQNGQPYSSSNSTPEDVQFESDTTKKVIIDSTDVLRFEDGVRQLVGNVILRQGDAMMFCDSAAIKDNNVNAFGNVILQQGDSIFVFSDTLVYIGETRKATLFGEVRLTDSIQILETNKLDYDLNERVGTYQDSATLTHQELGTRLTSKKGYYYVSTKEAFFRENVEVIDSNYTLQADTLKIDTETNVTHFVGPTYIQTKENDIYCEAGFYDTRNNYAEFEQNARLEKDDQIIEADKIRYDGEEDLAYIDGRSQVSDKGRTIDSDNAFYDAGEKVSKFRGNVIIRDSAQTIESDSVDYFSDLDLSIAMGNVVLFDEEEDLKVESEYAEYNNDSGYLKASGRPLVTNLIDTDTLWLAADTLFSYKVDSIDARILIAQNDVRVFKSDLQSICDSLVYSTVDSTFRFLQTPVMWTDSTQFSADTMTVFLVDKQINNIFMDQNAFIINTGDEVFFNQIKGRDIEAFFIDNELRRMDVQGNGESVYYLLDDIDAYVGVNKTICSEMLVYFGSNEVEQINFYTQPKATVYPMGKANHASLQMAGFQWLLSKKPKGKDDLR
ncbi:MAG: OstA-like protein [Bacteroidota bacterium]